jgi:hypothetical protein
VFQKTFELSAVNPKGCGGELCEGCWGRVFIDKAVLYRRLEALIELACKSFIVPFDKPLDAVEVGEVGGDGRELVQVPEFPFLGAHDIRVAEGVFQGLCVLLEGLELSGGFLGGAIHSSGVLIQEGLKPVVCGSIEIAGGEEDLLVLGREEFGAAEEVVSALGKV